MKGFSFVEIMVGLGIASILAVASSKMTEMSFRAKSELEIQNEKNRILDVLSTFSSCSLSLPSSSCSPGQLVTIRDYNNKVLVDASTPKYFGRLAVRAECDSHGQGVVLKAALLKNGRSLNSTDPDDFDTYGVKSTKLTFDDDTADLMSDGLSFCPMKKREIDCVRVYTSVASPPGTDVSVTCPVGYTVTGCTLACHNGSDDIDYYFNASNTGCVNRDDGCTSNRTIFAQCCRVRH